MKNEVFKKSQLISYTPKKKKNIYIYIYIYIVHKVANKPNLYCEFSFTVFCFLFKFYLK